MHSLAQACLETGRRAAEYSGEAFDGVVMDDDHCEAVQAYIDVINADWLEDGGDLRIEHRFDLKEIWPGLFGTNDACLVSSKILRVYDFKGGKGVAVEAEGNTQLLIYATGAMRALRRNQPFERVEMVIVQPRCPHRDGPVRRWTIDVTDLWTWTNDLLAALSRTMDPDAPLVAGDHCLFCPARPRCPALRDWSLKSARMDFGEAPPMASLLSTDDIVALLPKVELMDEFIRSVRAHALALAEGGHKLPGWKLVPKRAIRQWKHPGDVPPYLHRYGLTDKQIYTEPELRSPAQVEKLLPSGQRHIIETMIERKSSGQNLVPETSDPRAATPASVETDFKRME
jgi:hypothetical protein